MIKDVAGLVPGAYKGRGKGMAVLRLSHLSSVIFFLNHLFLSLSVSGSYETSLIPFASFHSCSIRLFFVTFEELYIRTSTFIPVFPIIPISSHTFSLCLLEGNRFLADLCDADVLVHVVDATGQSDKDGNVLGKGETGTAPYRISVTLYLCVCVSCMSDE